MTAVLHALAPLAYALLRVAVGLALVPHGLRNTFGFFPNTGAHALDLKTLANDLIERESATLDKLCDELTKKD